MSLLRRLWARRRERPALVAVAALLAVSLAAYPVVDWWLRATFEFASDFRFGDFGAYAGAVDRWQEGEPLYRRTDDGGFWGTYLYPPVVVLLFWPFEALLAFRDGAMAWLLATGVFLWTGLQALVAALGYDLRWYERLGLALLVAGFHPVVLTAKLGQTALFMGGLLAFAGAALVRDGRSRRPTDGPTDADLWDRPLALLAGAATAVVGVVKFACAPVGAHLLHDRRRLVGAVLVVPPVVWLSIRFFGVDAHQTYLDVLRWGVSQGSDGARSPTLWLAPYYKPLAWLPANATLGTAQAFRVAASAAIAGLAVLAPPRARRTAFALGVAAFPLLTPQTYTYYFVALLPAAVVLLAVEIERDGSPELVLLGVLLLHVHAYGLRFLVVTVPNAVPAFEALRPVYLLLQPGLWGNAVLVGLAAVRVVQATDLSTDLLPVGNTSAAGAADGD
ncbi:glycosyltransferase family 87 protein [Halosimplex halophilum]|uniref:glycosyltransferase family 87 protein n=1 Tax=Halosimplex halophilum TaxID=2559572 RepID=UPI00107F48D3|nr:glycosyltransferase family 87 protein [Halosimplex halophilum]